MENEKVNLSIEDFEDKVAKTGKKYTRFKTDRGWMSCFDIKMIEELKKATGQSIECLIATDEEKGFTNIRNVIGKANEDAVVVEKVGVPQETKELPGNRNTTMYVSYAKDLCAVMLGLDQEIPKQIRKPLMVMTEAIALVKQAQKAFS